MILAKLRRKVRLTKDIYLVQLKLAGLCNTTKERVMVRKTAIVVEILASGNNATFHFRCDKHIGGVVTAQTLKRMNYRTDANYLRSLSPEGKNLVTEMFAIPGITEISAYQYQVGISMGLAYSIEEVIPRVGAIIATLFYCNEEIGIDITVEHVGGMHAQPIRPLELRTGIEARMELERIMHCK